jgi:hypothetical protein
MYQLHKTLLEVLNATDEATITAEGLIEDVDIEDASGITAIQCKYHETQSAFVLSLIYKPVLQMMLHFHENSAADVKYVLYVHCPGEADRVRDITARELGEVLKSKGKGLAKYTSVLRDSVNLSGFRSRFTFRFGKSYTKLITAVEADLMKNGMDKSDIDTLVYPNAIQRIVDLSIQHDVNNRKITKPQLLSFLRQTKKTAVSRWTLSLQTRKKILDARKKQLKPNLSKNARHRFFLISESDIQGFDDDIVLFISDYLDKYHYKSTHISTPLFCLDSREHIFDDVQARLYGKGIVSADGYVGKNFDKERFFRQPMTNKPKGKPLKREFNIRFLRWATHKDTMNATKPDDIFIIGSSKYDSLDRQDVEVEHLAARNLNEIGYILGIRNDYE